MTVTSDELITPVIDARHLAWTIAHTLHIHGLVPDPRKAMSLDDLPSLEIVRGGRRFLINIEEL